ncbi:hypothetical protein JCGZ_21875 [Jatropha curcas]|uniref:PGG domain-containing protein n=1 Tax=Jatropha curcas TaxID=180498 RepID=A0A067JPD6_JATCU|nr:hypothetical protein JCGZ_21875 [Jatropha curcas]
MGSPLGTTNIDTEMHNLRTNLFKSAMRGEWNKVVASYRVNPKSYSAQITRSGDTSLHLAVRDGQEDIVEELLKLMSSHPDEAKAALEIANDQKNTALHLAAAGGTARMCSCIANLEPSLIGQRNGEGETPLFWAALHGKKETFFCLHSICGLDQGRSYYRRTCDGDTILHVAIAGEFFDLAFQIIYLYEELANTHNQKGITPLHLLASKPNAFRSGTHLGAYQKMIYHCIFVEELKMEEISNQSFSVTASNNNSKPTYPENYEACMDILLLIKKGYEFGKRISMVGPSGIQVATFVISAKKLSLEGTKLFSKTKKSPTESPRGDAENQQGSSDIRKLEDKKKKHTWSVQIMEELLQRATMYEYTFSGKSPHSGNSTDDENWDEQINEISQTIEDDLRKDEVNTKQKDLTVKKETPILFPEKEGVDKLLSELVEYFPVGDKNMDMENVIILTAEKPKTSEKAEKETPILIAAKNGIKEMVDKILEKFPVAIHDEDAENKNVVLLAVENRQPHVYELLLKRKVMRDIIFRKLDNKGNSALHLAAMLGDSTPWRIPGAALQMQWEIKWYWFVRHSMPPHFFTRHNKDNKTAKAIFTETHKDLVKSGGEWLINTSESCSVVAALIATVAFATAATVPGGVDEKKGTPTLERHPAFNAFAISSVVALSFSVTSVVMFLAILTSRYEEKDFGRSLPNKLLLGLTSLFVSIAAMLVSFCAGHFFVLRDELKYAAFPIYAVTCLPVTLFAIAQFPLYVDLMWASFKKVPQRSYSMVR